MKSRLLLVLVGLSAIASTPVSAQQARNARLALCDPTKKQAVSIRGRIVEDSTGRPVYPRGVFLVGTECYSGTDSLGEFTFHAVRPGEYRVGIAPLSYRPHAPVPVVVKPDTVSDVGTIRLRPENSWRTVWKLNGVQPYSVQVPHLWFSSTTIRPRRNQDATLR
jgi:hypothetical protein